MPVISLIAAMARNRVIGKDGGLPWHLPDEFRHFKRITRGKPVIMGRRTWESLDGPLEGRENFVVTRQRDYRAPGATVVHSLGEALAELSDREEIVIAGGEKLYEEGLARADRMYLTYVDAELDGDTHFPAFDSGAWRELDREHHAADARHAYAFTIVTYERAQ